eukprot:scaffold12977_cov119-Isochrysis_galbana.AAC.6
MLYSCGLETSARAVIVMVVMEACFCVRVRGSASARSLTPLSSVLCPSVDLYLYMCPVGAPHKYCGV